MLLQSIVLGVIQGISEFLPISSSAHLVLAPYFFSWDDPGLAYDVALHMGTLVAVLLFFWKDWLGILKSTFGQKHADHGQFGLKMLIVGTVPAAVAGLLFEKQAEETFRSPLLIAGTLAVFGLLLWYADARGKRSRQFDSFTTKDALTIGAAQAFAIIPGVSRSGSTITAALALGLTRPAAARFSFLLSAPIIAGAGILKSKHIIAALAAGGPGAQAVVVGFLASLLSGLAAIALLSYMVKARSFAGFAIYRILLALVIVVVIVVNR